ncbi:MAG: acetoacetate decarboxylase family protein [Turneriella sp.]|nr:acetoacetate decarboxylase family protein [Turneriella sp.]
MAKKEFPPPWQLEGSGVVILFPAHKKRVLESGLLAEEDARTFVGGVGAVMLVHYEKSNCGPYDELLYIPGFFAHRGKNYLRITRIWVSTPESVEWGRRNWAIPKELAQFNWQKNRDGWHIDVRQMESGDNIYSISLKPRLFALPVTTALLPFSLLQRRLENGNSSYFLETRPTGNGWAQLAFVDSIEGSRALPDYHSISSPPRLALAIPQFRLTFPVPQIVYG